MCIDLCKCFCSDKQREWRPEDRFGLRKILADEDFATPQKPFLLPVYAEKSAKRLIVEKSPILFWGRKGKRSGLASKIYVDDEAEETDREETSSVTGSSDTNSSSDSENGETQGTKSAS
jgi:hypothetical protein